MIEIFWAGVVIKQSDNGKNDGMAETFFRLADPSENLNVADHWMISLENGFIVVVAENFIPDEEGRMKLNDVLIEHLRSMGVVG